MLLETTESESPGAGPGIAFLPAPSYPTAMTFPYITDWKPQLLNYFVDLKSEELGG